MTSLSDRRSTAQAGRPVKLAKMDTETKGHLNNNRAGIKSTGIPWLFVSLIVIGCIGVAAFLHKEDRRTPPTTNPFTKPTRPPRSHRPHRENEDIHVAWLFVSLIPLFLLGCAGIGAFLQQKWQARNEERKLKLIKEMTGWEPKEEEEAQEVRKVKEKRKTAGNAVPARPVVAGFWHPYCNAGGGGERVLWTAIAWTQANQKNVLSLVYTGDYPAASKEEILARVKSRFSLHLNPSTIHLIPLPSRYFISDSYFPRFTLLLQSLSSIYLAYQGFVSLPTSIYPDIFIDTMGYAFILPFLCWLSGGKTAIGAYVHYPTVSEEMVKRVEGREVSVENKKGVAGSWLKTFGKVIYYRIFTQLYAFSLLFSSFTMTNSTWTQNHITSLLSLGRRSYLSTFMTFPLSKNGTGEEMDCKVVYPPCDTREFLGAKLEGRERVIVSLAQFRPEKDHAKQLRALSHLFKSHPEYSQSGKKAVKMVLMGGVRDEGDENRVEGLRALAKSLNIDSSVEFIVNASFPELVKRLGTASIGINTMQDEHFGINIVEFMASGLIPLVHASAGPLLDIVVEHNGKQTGYHAKNAEEFGDRLFDILEMEERERVKMRRAARELAVDKFSQEEFEMGWAQVWDQMMDLKERLNEQS